MVFSHRGFLAFKPRLVLATEVGVTFCDNGRGLSKESEQHVFESFFTTARKQGDLGMAIVFDLITQKLGGSIELKSSKSGACFYYTFKANDLSKALA